MFGVDVTGLMVRNPPKEFFGLGALPCPLIQISKRVCPPKMMFHWTFRAFPSLAKQPHRFLEPTLICECSSSDDSAFNYELGRW